MKQSFSAIIIATMLSACASSPKAIPEDLSVLSSGKKGAILASYGGYTRCHEITLKFQNIKTKDEIKSNGLGAKWMGSPEKARSKISVIPVLPGQYKFLGGTCVVAHGQGSTTVDFKGVTNWFESFEVNSGEVVYPGSLMSEVVAHKVDSVLGIVPEFIMRAPTDKYQIFDQKDQSIQVKQRLAEEAPSLSEKFTTRLAPKRLEGDIVKQILNDVYKSEGTKDRPDGRVASSKANLEIAKYLFSGEYTPKN